MASAGGRGGSIVQRIPGSRLRLWLLLEGNRVAVAAVVLGGFFLGLVVLVGLDPAGFERAVRRGDPIQTLFQALVTVIVTGATLVVSINSLVLSQELGPVGKKREEMDAATAFRADVADLVGAPVGPAAPSRFLLRMLETTAEHADALRTIAVDATDDETRERLTTYADRVGRRADRATDQLADAEFGTFDVVSAALDFDYSLLIYEGKHVAGRRGDSMSEEGRARLDDLLTVLDRFGPAREHVKTLYFQWELVDLSRAMLYAAVPALVVSAASILLLGGIDPAPGTTLGLPDLAWVVCAAATVALSPFAVLIAYILRIATVAKRTLAIGPFVLRGGDEVEAGRSEGE